MKPKIIVVANRKGGSAKSTTCLNIAVQAERDGESVMLIELDDQGSIADWSRQRTAETPLYGIAENADDLEPLIAAAKEQGCTTVLIDTPGHRSPNVDAAIRLASFVLIPIRPAVFDLNAVVPTVQASKQAGKPFGFVITIAPPQQQRVLEMASALSETAPVAPVVLGNRIDYVDSIRDGLAAVEFNPSGKAANETAALWQWIKGKIDG